MSFIKPAKFFLTLSSVLVLASVALLFVPGLKLSIDFTGGTQMELRFPGGTTKEQIVDAIETFATEPAIENPQVSIIRSDEQSAGAVADGEAVAVPETVTALIRIRELKVEDNENTEFTALMDHLSDTIGTTEQKQFTSIGPTVGSSLRERSLVALAVAAAAIIVYIAIAFRKVPRKLSPLKFGVIAVITLLHDVIISVGVFIIISQYTSFEFDTLFITALLTIIGYSVNDTIVIFDRIRENLSLQNRKEAFEDVADRSLRESIPRSINTSVSTLIMLCALFFLGSESIKWFVLALIVGAIVGTYSSIFLATPLLVYWRKK